MRFAFVFGSLAIVVGFLAARLASGATGWWWVPVVLVAYGAFGLFAVGMIYGLHQAGVAVESWLARPDWVWVTEALFCPTRG
jgi:hypothetical protein